MRFFHNKWLVVAIGLDPRFVYNMQAKTRFKAFYFKVLKL